MVPAGRGDRAWPAPDRGLAGGTTMRVETIRFVVLNTGKYEHEMVLGTMKELEEHSEMMKQHRGMHHDEAHMAHVPPGKSGVIVWQFTKPGEFFYACLVEDHFELGMYGKITVHAHAEHSMPMQHGEEEMRGMYGVLTSNAARSDCG